MIPAVPLLAILAAHSINEVSNWISFGGRARGIILMSFILFILLPPMSYSVIHSVASAKGDTRLLSLSWANENGLLKKKSFRYENYCFTKEFGHVNRQHPRIQASLSYYKPPAVTDLCVSSYIYDRFLTEPIRFEKYVKVYNHVFKQELLKEFVPIKTRSWSDIHYVKSLLLGFDQYVGVPGPTIRFYHFREDLSTEG